MKSPIVSVITASFNDGQYLIDALQSVEKSTYDNIEHIIIDDGSTDPYTLEVLASIVNPRVRVIYSENQGVCRARNTAIKQSYGKYILPLDGDDFISSEYILKAVEQLEGDDNVRIVSCNYRYFGLKSDRVMVEQYSMEKLLGRNLYVVSSVFRRTDFDRVGGFNENMDKGLEDWNLWIDILELKGRVFVLDGEHFFYRIKPPSTSRNSKIDSDVLKDLRRLIWENHRELYAQYFPDPLQTYEYLGIANSREYKWGKILLYLVNKILKK